MSGAPERAEEGEIPGGDAAPDVINLPDQRQHGRKKVTSGSNNRKRRHLEWFRTDDAEHAALHEKVRASGKSLGALVMELLAIEGGKESRSRKVRRPVRADVSAFLQGCVEISRVNTQLNQQTRAANTAMLFAAEHGAERLADEVRAWRLAIEALGEQFAAPIAKIHAALDNEREG